LVSLGPSFRKAFKEKSPERGPWGGHREGVVRGCRKDQGKRKGGGHFFPKMIVARQDRPSVRKEGRHEKKERKGADGRGETIA